MTLTVIEMDQHSSTADQIDEGDFETWKQVLEASEPNEVPKLSGGDAEAAQAIHGGQYRVKEVDEDDSPGWGYVWYQEAEDGSMEVYKANYATK